MPSYQCFMVERTMQARLSWRRYSSQPGENPHTSLGGFSYHNAKTLIGDLDCPPTKDDYDVAPKVRELERLGHAQAWPIKCEECDYAFTDADMRQVFLERIYEGNGWRGTLHEAPPGAIWRAHWIESRDSTRRPQPGEASNWVGPDGLSLYVQLPNDAYEWLIDGPSSGGGFWTRSGEPPIITVTPSIQVGERYHGYLTNGVLTDV